MSDKAMFQQRTAPCWLHLGPEVKLWCRPRRICKNLKKRL